MLPQRSLHIVADAHIWEVRSAFSRLPGYDVTLEILENQQITAERLKTADILLTRSSTRVNAALLQNSTVRFAATATIGDDHYDKAWLEQQQIFWCNAAGSSTGSVIEYMLTLLLELHQQQRITMPDLTLGIIGAGRIGSALATICEQIGMRVLLCDPPRARIEGEEKFVTLDEILEQADVISLHTPLNRSGRDCTLQLINQPRLQQFRGSGIINAARGDCIDNSALLQWLDRSPNHFCALDCWQHEPAPLQALLMHSGMAIATPHIAGHSLDGKAANTQVIYDKLCRHLQITPIWHDYEHLPPVTTTLNIPAAANPWQQLHQAATELYPIMRDHRAITSWGAQPENELRASFRHYRRHYPIRRSWKQTPLRFTAADHKTLKLATVMGFNLVTG